MRCTMRCVTAEERSRGTSDTPIFLADTRSIPRKQGTKQRGNRSAGSGDANQSIPSFFNLYRNARNVMPSFRAAAVLL